MKNVDFKLINNNDSRIFLEGCVDITTIDDDEPDFEYMQNDGTYATRIPAYWKTDGEDLTTIFQEWISGIEWDMFQQYLYDFQDDEKRKIFFNGDILLINW